MDRREITVTSASERDTYDTAALHVAELPHGLFPRLGPDFVQRWHRAHLRSPYGTVVVANDGTGVVGFALGTESRRAHVAWVVENHRVELLRSALKAAMARPGLIVWFFRSRGLGYVARLWRPARRMRATANQASPVTVLEALVVAPEVRGQNIGSMLVDAFLTEVAAAEARQVELVTKAGPSGAAEFYERRGWHRTGSHVDRDGDRVLSYRIDTRNG